jgi:hypothetical protein
VLGGPAGPQPEIDALWRRVQTAIAREKGPAAWLRNLPTGWRITVAWAGATAMTVTLAVASLRVDLGVYPQARLALTVGSLALLLGVLIALSLRPLQRRDISTRALVFALVALLAPFLISLFPEATLAQPVPFRDAHDCLLLGIIGGAALMMLLRVLDRSTSGARSLVVPAAAGGVLANLALSLHCPVVSPLHLTLIHAPIGLVLLFGSKGFRATKRRLTRARSR